MSQSTERASKWRFFSWRTALLVAVVFYTFVGFVVVPWIAKGVVLPKIGEKLGSEIIVGKISCNPYTLALTVQGLSVPDRSGSPLLSFDEMYANLQASSLFRRALVLKEFRVENPYVAVRRLPDGEVNLLEVMAALKSEEPAPDEEWSLPRTVLQEIRMNGGRFELEDQARDEPLLLKAGPGQLHLNDISTLPGDEGDNHFVIGLAAGGALDIAGDVVVEPLGLDGSLKLDNMVLTNAWPLIREKFEFDLAGGNLSASLQYHIRLENDELKLQIEGSGFQLTELSLRTRDNADLATIGSVTASGLEAAWPELTVRVESLVVDRATAQVWIEADGTPSWADLVPKQTQDRIVETYKKVKEQVDVDAKLDRFEISNASASFENRTFAEPHRIEVADVQLALKDVSSEPESQWDLVASAAIAGESRASIKGFFVALPVTLDAQVGLENLELSQFQAYVEKVAPLRLLAGALSTVGNVQLVPKKENGKISFQGELAVQGLDLDETVTGGTLLGLGDLKVAGIEATVAPISLRVARADVHTAGLEIAVAEDGTINLLEFTKALGGGESPGEVSAESSEPREKKDLPPVQIAAIELHDCYGVYKDATTPTPFERSLQSINGTVSNITTSGEDVADLEINANLDSGGSVSVTGQMDLLQYTRLTDLAVDISDVRLTPMSPMSVKIIGHPIEGGKTSLDLDYKIEDYQLQATNHVEVYNLQLGEEVEGEGKIKAPVKLGVSMLKDKNGQITLDVPMEGDLRDPEFVVASAISSAIAGVVGDLVKSPFRMLGRMVGGSDDQNLEYVDFDAGSAVLVPQVSTNLATLATALQDRPELGLEMSGVFDPQTDTAALREATLLKTFDVDLATGSFEDVPTRKLESRYEELTSPSQAAMIRGRHMSEDGVVDETGFREALWAQLLAGQEVSETDVRALAPARAEAVRTFLVDQSGIDSARVVVLPDPVTVETENDKVRLQLGLNTGD